MLFVYAQGHAADSFEVRVGILFVGELRAQDDFFFSTELTIVVSATIQISSSHSESGNIIDRHGLLVLMPPPPHSLTRQLPCIGHVCNALDPRNKSANTIDQSKRRFR